MHRKPPAKVHKIADDDFEDTLSFYIETLDCAPERNPQLDKAILVKHHEYPKQQQLPPTVGMLSGLPRLPRAENADSVKDGKQSRSRHARRVGPNTCRDKNFRRQ